MTLRAMDWEKFARDVFDIMHGGPVLAIMRRRVMPAALQHGLRGNACASVVIADAGAACAGAPAQASPKSQALARALAAPADDDPRMGAAAHIRDDRR